MSTEKIAPLPLILVQPIAVPEYINRNIDDMLVWMSDNDYHLKFYYEALMDSRPADEPILDPAQFRRAQYTEERMRLRNEREIRLNIALGSW